MARLLVVDDDAAVRQALVRLLSHAGHAVEYADSGTAALATFIGDGIDVVLLDLMMPGLGGMDTLRALVEKDPSVPCILMTAHGAVRSAVEAMRSGAYDYVQKPFDNDELLETVKRALEKRRLSREVLALREELATRSPGGELVGTSASMRDVFRLMQRAADTDATVLILGESGTGKELVARGIHKASARARAPFIAVDCGALPDTLIESELFGAERGAYTGADRMRKGLFEQAAGGVLFLDEIGNLPASAQAVLLRVLQERVIRRVGGSSAIPVDVRVVAATNEELTGSASRFRSDLYHRLNVLSIGLPPLRDRIEDIPFLTDHFVARICDEMNRPPKTVAAEVRALLVAHPWPGNVRELEHALRRAIVNGDGDVIVARDLPPEIRGEVVTGASASAEPVPLAEDVRRVAEEFERRRILEALDATGGNRLEAAMRLRLPIRTLFRKLNYYGISREADGSDTR